MAKKQPRFQAMNDDPVTVAQRLLGQLLVRNVKGIRMSGIIVETEAYLGAVDAAAHTYKGRRTPRNESMYLPGGHAYVYFTYGMHFCLNVVCGKQDEGVAVLIRALEPIDGVSEMFANRPKAKRNKDLCSGPGKLTQALGIDRNLNGVDLRTNKQLFIERIRNRKLPYSDIRKTPRIGLNGLGGKADAWVKRPLRYCINGNQFCSR